MLEQRKRSPSLDRALENLRTRTDEGLNYRNLPEAEKLAWIANCMAPTTKALGADDEKHLSGEGQGLRGATAGVHSWADQPWPRIYRLTRFRYEQIEDRRFTCTAMLFHERASVQVCWTVRQPDLRLNNGSGLVRVNWSKSKPTSADGIVRVDRVVVLERPERCANLFETIPNSWVKNRRLVKLGIDLMNRMSSELRHLFNGIFWDGERFKRFCIGPSSLRHHHAEENGNLTHSLDVALGILRELEQPVLLGDGVERPSARAGAKRSDSDVLVAAMAGLLHDAGKADEYRVLANGTYGMSERGRLLGHKTTVVEWIAIARAKCPTGITEREYLDLIHTMTAVSGAPEWLGIRGPDTVAASLLSSLDRISGARDQPRLR